MFYRALPALAGMALACSGAEPTPEPTPAAVERPNVDLFKPSLTETLAKAPTAQEQLVIDLGRHLYYEKRLSSNDAIACNSCHLLDKYGVDGEAFSKGVPGTPVGRNSPTVYNAFLHIAQFWDGRAPDVEAQAKGPILAGKEMGMPSPESVVSKLNGIPEYPPLFAAAFPDQETSLSYDNVGVAIGAFERRLTTPGRWDKYLDGDDGALTDEEVKGLNTFTAVGCTACHSGTLLGGAMYQKLGLIEPWPNQEDQGRFALTEQEADKMMFKVPSLRNIEKTGPYFHDSSATTLEAAIAKMGKHQLGKELNEDEVASISAFLKALTGELPTEYIAQRPLGE